MKDLRLKTLNLTLNKKWFDMIVSGEKKQEYREFKPYWINRFCRHEYHGKVSMGDLIYGNEDYFNRQYELVKFTNGYGNDKPFVILELDSFSVGNGNEAWGFTHCCFILNLGQILTTGNIK